jgi:hypothetical protein
MAVQHLILWLRNKLAVKSAILMHQYDIHASIKDYEQATGVVESRGSMDYFAT